MAYSASCRFALVDDASLTVVCRRTLNAAKSDVKAGGEDRTPAVDASPPPTTASRAWRRGYPPLPGDEVHIGSGSGWMKEEDTRMMSWGRSVPRQRRGVTKNKRRRKNTIEEDNE